MMAVVRENFKRLHYIPIRNDVQRRQAMDMLDVFAYYRSSLLFHRSPLSREALHYKCAATLKAFEPFARPLSHR
jgi:hypothetical protein